MRILIIPDSFKESLTANEVSQAIHRGIIDVLPNAEVVKIPFSDGGEGAIEVLMEYSNGELVHCITENALGEKCAGKYFLFKEKKAAWIELSQASGLAQINPEKRDILRASTYGTGLLIKDALSKGCKEIILGVGGSATNDGGAGIFEALGGQLLDHQGNKLERGGGSLNILESIIPLSISKDIKWRVACDVKNKLLGNYGSTTVYGPQKGAGLDEVKLLEKSLAKFAKVLEKHFRRPITKIEGGGAAGGAAAGMHGFFNASLESGFSLLARMINLENKIKKADLIFTAEGRIDKQSTEGKLTGSVARLAKKNNVPVIGLAGSIEHPYSNMYNAGFSGIFSIQNGPLDMVYSKKNAAVLLTDTSARVLNLYIKSNP
jgi:glycerate kinase